MSDTALPDNRRFLVIDPLHHDPIDTTRGHLTGDETNMFTVKSPELAAEIREKEPWNIVREMELPPGGNQAARMVWTVPEMPWKRQQNPLESAGTSTAEVPADVG